jgi:hypothetical protein
MWLQTPIKSRDLLIPVQQLRVAALLQDSYCGRAATNRYENRENVNKYLSISALDCPINGLPDLR